MIVCSPRYPAMATRWIIGMALSTCLVGTSVAQDDISSARPSSRFGFFVGADRSMPSVTLRPRSGPPPQTASITDVSPHPTWGFSMGVLYEQEISERFAFRAMPSLSFAEVQLDYAYSDGTSERRTWESADLGLAIQAVGTTTANGLGPYFGLGPAMQLAVGKDVSSPTPRFSIDASVGYRFKVSSFYMAPELRYSYGLTNMTEDDSSIQTQAIEQLRNHVLSLAIVFQD